MPDRQIYVADLAAYNAGHLHGVWIDIDSDIDVMEEQVKEMLAKSPVPDAEEYAIHDISNCQDLGIKEHTSLKEVAAIAEFLESANDEDAAIAAVSLAYNLDGAKDLLENYLGCADTLAAWGEEYYWGILSEEIPEKYLSYFDFEAFTRDMSYNGDIQTHKMHGRVYVFGR